MLAYAYELLAEAQAKFSVVLNCSRFFLSAKLKGLRNHQRSPVRENELITEAHAQLSVA
jgi:hypothetical protein